MDFVLVTLLYLKILDYFLFFTYWWSRLHEANIILFLYSYTLIYCIIISYFSLIHQSFFCVLVIYLWNVTE